MYINSGEDASNELTLLIVHKVDNQKYYNKVDRYRDPMLVMLL